MNAACLHAESEIRWRKTSNGVRQAWRQCLTCHQVVGTAVKHADVPMDAGEFDEVAREDYWQQISDAYRSHRIVDDALRDAQREQRREEYRDYLNTIAWRQKREAVLERDNYRCQASLPGCIGRASQAHHLTYDRIFDEPLFDLVAVCRPCHERLHASRDHPI